MTTATAPKKHRAVDRVALLEAQVVKLTASAIQGVRDGEALAAARARIEELQQSLGNAVDRHAETVAEMKRESDALRQRLTVACLAGSAAAETQAIDTETVRLAVDPTILQRFERGSVVRAGARRAA